MKRVNQILSGAFIFIMLFLNLVLTVRLGNSLHAHILSDNKILIHFHYSNGGEHAQGHSNSCSSGFSFSTYISYINDSQVLLTSAFVKTIYNISLTSVVNIVAIENYQIPAHRGPPHFLS